MDYGNTKMINGGQALSQSDGQVMRHPLENPIKREPEIASELARLSKAVEQIGMFTDQLAARLGPVLRQTGAQTANMAGVGAPEPVLCGVATEIRMKRQALDRYSAQLRQALDELEI